MSNWQQELTSQKSDWPYNHMTYLMDKEGL